MTIPSSPPIYMSQAFNEYNLSGARYMSELLGRLGAPAGAPAYLSQWLGLSNYTHLVNVNFTGGASGFSFGYVGFGTAPSPPSFGGVTINRLSFSSTGASPNSGTILFQFPTNKPALTSLSINGNSLGPPDSTNSTSYTWNARPNYFGTTTGVNIPCIII